MSFLKKIFSNKDLGNDQKKLPWLPLNELEQLDLIKAQSKTKTQLIFKHSTRCGISRMVMSQFVASYDFNEKEFDLYLLDLLQFRNVSLEIATKFQVIHESPQLLIIKNETVVAHASHGAINDMDLTKFS